MTDLGPRRKRTIQEPLREPRREPEKIPLPKRRRKRKAPA